MWFNTDNLPFKLGPELSYNESTQTTMVAFDKVIPKGTTAKLKMKFSGVLNDKMAGFYRSTYKNADGVREFLQQHRWKPRTQEEHFHASTSHL